jgi:periplasmic protein TonB
MNTDGGDVVEMPPPPQVQQDDVLKFAEQMPEFPGGNDALQQYLKKTIIYPFNARDEGRQGSVYVNFIVKKDGTIADVKIAKGVKDSPDLDKEAIRVISSMPNWIPGKVNGRSVNVQMTLPIRFKLD